LAGYLKQSCHCSGFLLYVHNLYGKLPVVPLWMHRDCRYRAYTVISVDDLYNPFASMYFGASYLGWLSQYEGRLAVWLNLMKN